MTTDRPADTITLRHGVPTPADLYLDGHPLSHLLGWDETLACLDRAIARLFTFFRAAQDRPDRTPLDIFLFEGGWVYAKRDGLAGPVLWLFLLEQLRAGMARRPLARLEIENDLHVPAEFLRAARDELGLVTPDPAGFPAHASAEIRDPRDRMGKWRWLWRSVLRVATTRPDPAVKGAQGRCLLISTASMQKHRYGTLIDDLHHQIGDGTRLIGVHPKERAWASDADYPPGVISAHRGGGPGAVLRAAWIGWRVMRRQRQLAPDMRRVDPVLASMLTYRYPHAFHAALHALCIEALVRRLRPAAFIRNGNYNTPDERRTNWACRRAGVPTIVVTPRSLSTRMPAMPMDYRRERDSLPVGYVVSDERSRALLHDWGVPDRDIALGSLEILAEETPQAPAEPGPVCALILLDNRRVSGTMIRQILDALPATNIRLLVRAHPLTPFSAQPDVLQALEGRDWEDVTGVLMRKVVRPDRTLAFSPCSGAGVDAVRCGAALVWMPYLSSNAPAHMDAIASTGTVCDGASDLPRHTAVLADPAALARQARTDRDTLRAALTPTHTPLVDAVCALIAARQGTPYTRSQDND
ncbi:hypothetical protein [Rhodovulum adriaticum]|uniref:Uncharacterized protein n=1 Tax=Rhodovulum adriaticum TaxID=35804 RepID=A0A4R2P023_RHOAD|nr:hypothetical protein [Rhodovulum adriaticum]MBK1634225.1 hypothetical protein [Rhodovulum adriaticum]TCP27224.1 hypothetical protein EV656_101127 [Rhodovulum adriaticum]